MGETIDLEQKYKYFQKSYEYLEALKKREDKSSITLLEDYTEFKNEISLLKFDLLKYETKLEAEENKIMEFVLSSTDANNKPLYSNAEKRNIAFMKAKRESEDIENIENNIEKLKNNIKDLENCLFIADTILRDQQKKETR